LASLAKLTKIGCTDMTCSAGCTSTGELHERVYASFKAFLGRLGDLGQRDRDLGWDGQLWRARLGVPAWCSFTAC
jgi:hypothetical protein